MTHLLMWTMGEKKNIPLKENNIVHCSNYDKRYYRLWYCIPSSSEEEVEEHSCAPTDVEATMTKSPAPKQKGGYYLHVN